MTNYIENAEKVAVSEINEINSSLAPQFKKIIKFLLQHPDLSLKSRSKEMETGSAEYIKKLAVSFSNGRNTKKPKLPDTQQDIMVSIILEKYFNVEPINIENAIAWHRSAMGAENIIGHLLECYIADKLEDKGWVWCSGSVVKSVDFIYVDQEGKWRALQVKNRDNSENSSSSAIRNGTKITKWFRTFSKKAGDNWSEFPENQDTEFSDKDFREFVENYLARLKAV